MHNPTVFRAQFSGLIITVFGKPQTLKWTPQIEMYQARDSPELWCARPPATAGQFKWQATSPVELARIIEQCFVERLTQWIPAVSTGPSRQLSRPENVVVINSKRRA